MNNRQKAKHWKKLYEEGLPKKTYPVVYQTILPKHYKIQHSITRQDIAYTQDTPQLLRTHIENQFLKELRSLIWENLKTETDIYTDTYKYSIDIWM